MWLNNILSKKQNQESDFLVNSDRVRFKKCRPAQVLDFWFVRSAAHLILKRAQIQIDKL